MTRAFLPLALASAVALTACAGGGINHEPIIDGPYTQTYAMDVAQCRQIADGRGYDNADVRTAAALGAGLGALAGLIGGGRSYHHHWRGHGRRDNADKTEDVLLGAAIGAATGGGAQALKTREQRRQILLNCLAGRGHRVLG